MAIDLASAIGRYLTPEVVGKIASASGLNGTVAQSAATAAVPSILSALVNMVATPGGPKKLADAVASQPGSVLAEIASKSNGSAQMATQGSNLLSSLLGGGVANLLASTVGKFLGIGEGPVKTVMGLLTPVILGVLGNQQRAADLDSNGLARLLSGQKDQIAEAMPSGLSDALKISGLFPSVSTTPSPGRRTVDTPTTPANALAPQTPLGPRRGPTGSCLCSRWQGCSGTCCRAHRRRSRSRPPSGLSRAPSGPRSIWRGYQTGGSRLAAHPMNMSRAISTIGRGRTSAR